MLLGFPPVHCRAEDYAPLGSLVASGASLTFRRLEPPPPEPSAATSTAWVCSACTFENATFARACVVCETPRPAGSSEGGGGGDAAGISSSGNVSSSLRVTTAVLEKMRDDNSCLFHGVAWLLDPARAPRDMREGIAQAVLGGF